MSVNGTGPTLDEVARDLFGVLAQLGLAVPRGRRRAGGLKEIEFVALSLLRRRRLLTVGELQRLLGVLPAQMSRVLRGLEGRDRPLVACRINPQDKRKINVALTAAGSRALAAYHAARVGRLTALLSHLPADDLGDLHRLVEHVRGMIFDRRAPQADAPPSPRA
jgi:DNA-binding MarR family transcriptional regulator